MCEKEITLKFTESTPLKYLCQNRWTSSFKRKKEAASIFLTFECIAISLPHNLYIYLLEERHKIIEFHKSQPICYKRLFDEVDILPNTIQIKSMKRNCLPFAYSNEDELQLQQQQQETKRLVSSTLPKYWLYTAKWWFSGA